MRLQDTSGNEVVTFTEAGAPIEDIYLPSFHMGPDDDRQQWLLECFDPNKPTEVVNAVDLVTFLRTFEEHTKLVGIDPALYLAC